MDDSLSLVLQMRKSYRLCDWPRPLTAILLTQRHQAPANARPPSSPKSTMSSLNRGAPPTCLIRPSDSTALASIDGAEDKE